MDNQKNKKVICHVKNTHSLPTTPVKNLATLEPFVGLATFKVAPRLSKVSANE